MLRTVFIYVKYACWSLGAVGLLAVFNLYSEGAHFDLFILSVMASLAVAFLVIGFVIHGWQRSGPR